MRRPSRSAACPDSPPKRVSYDLAVAEFVELFAAKTEQFAIDSGVIGREERRGVNRDVRAGHFYDEAGHHEIAPDGVGNVDKRAAAPQIGIARQLDRVEY